jgi:hypothetical protein
MASWRDELVEAVKSKDERDAEERERQRKRVAEALEYAERALSQGLDALRFCSDKLKSKGQSVDITEGGDSNRLTLGDLTIGLELARDTAVIRVLVGDGKPREFDFAKDRHIAPADVEEYVGRRVLELVRAAQKTKPW